MDSIVRHLELEVAMAVRGGFSGLLHALLQLDQGDLIAGRDLAVRLVGHGTRDGLGGARGQRSGQGHERNQGGRQGSDGGENATIQAAKGHLSRIREPALP